MKEKPVCVEQGQKLAKEVMSPCWIPTNVQSQQSQLHCALCPRAAENCSPLISLISALPSGGKTVSLTVDRENGGVLLNIRGACLRSCSTNGKAGLPGHMPVYGMLTAMMSLKPLVGGLLKTRSRCLDFTPFLIIEIFVVCQIRLCFQCSWSDIR